MPGRQCNKIIHFTRESAERHRTSLGKRHGKPPNIYRCDKCSTENLDIFHVGYGYDASKLSKRARRARKQAQARSRRRG